MAVRNAMCPKCRGEMGMRAAACPHCGYDFQPPPERRFIPVWQLVLIAAITVAAIVTFDGNPIVQAITGVCGVLFWLGLFLDVRRFFRGP